MAAATTRAATTKGATTPPAPDAGSDQQTGEAQAQESAERKTRGSGLVQRERNGNEGQPRAVALLRKVCGVFGVDPDPLKVPVELLTWTFYGGDDERGVPDAVSIVTANGRKLKVYADDSVDDDTVAMLARVFKVPPHADGSPWAASELPEDLTLPVVEVTGMSAEQSHIYQKGYLKEGGKAEAARRQSLRKKAAK